MAAEWRGDVPTLVLLNQMVGDDLPLGLRSEVTERFFQRDIYFDSADRALRRRGVTCRFRVRVDDTRVLTVHVVGVGPGGPPPEIFEAAVPELDGAQALAGTSEPARRLRGLIEPERLTPRISFETERRVRRTSARWFARGQYDLSYDVVTVRSGPAAQTFQELKIRERRRGRPGLDTLARAFAERYNLRPLLVGKLDRAEKTLRELESTAITQGTLDNREVALIVVQGREVALIGDASDFTVPIGSGRGEERSRALLRTHFGSADAQLRFLGTAPGSGSRPSLEVWLGQRAGSAPEPAGRIQWLPYTDVLAAAGGPGFRDARTLAALGIVTRSGVLETAVERAPVPVARRRRMSDVALRAVSSELEQPGVERFLNAELSVLEFNARVLALAEDARVPLLARLRFLSIFSGNLDEFFMVQVGGLKSAEASGGTGADDDGLSAEQRLAAIRLRVHALLERQYRCLRQELLPALAAHGVELSRWADLGEPRRETLRRHFKEQIFPIMTPQAITRAPGHPFPLVPNLRLSLAVVVHDQRRDSTQFVYLKIPDGVPRFIPVPPENDTTGTHRFVPVEDVIRENLNALYPGLQVQGAYAFRVTRGADLELDERHAVSLLQVIGEEASRRPFGAPVRLEVERAMPPSVRELVLHELQFEDAVPDSLLDAGDIYESGDGGLVDLGAVRELARVPLESLDYPPHRATSPIPSDRSIFDVLTERDVLIHHPYDAFEETVERLFKEAADDPGVLAIKLTLYRAGGRSGIVDALLRAAERGKDVFVFVELKARFDEERNIEWARTLERRGIHVVYGLVDLKTHAKTALVVRREESGIKQYVHIGTGNYNAATAALYTDVGLLTADPVIASDVHDLFNELSGSSQAPRTPFRAILVSPVYLLPKLLELIAREAEHARAGRRGGIKAKLNGLADPDVVNALYQASKAGVEIEMVVRGLCTLRPGVLELSENIRVVSVLGRFLEHARIIRFENGGDPEYYIGSADWRPRNLRRRVEVVAPVRDPACRRSLDQILASQLSDPNAWDLLSDGTYRRRES
ncbi:MAG TPA: polyphosphate kinase 1 [Gemmatimonadales bacterium]|nr:polyphosphate kinase 1 [Gemmatimonadales bacterium]